MQSSSGGLKSAPSALDEETLVKIALDISKAEEDKRQRDLNVKALEERRPPESVFVGEEGKQSSPEAQGIPVLVPANNEVGDRIRSAPTRRHILRQNSVHWSNAEPSNHEDDRQRLLENLKLFGLVEKEVKGDGNCQFRALSDQLYHTPSHHDSVRSLVVKQLKSTPEVYRGFVDDNYGSYCHSMAKNGTWGDHITLQAAADALRFRILVISSFKEECVIEILPKLRQPGSRTLFLSFWHEIHYGSVYPHGNVPPPAHVHKTMGSTRLHRLFHN